MNLDNVDFFNLGALEPIPGLGDKGMVRIPAKVRNQLNERARFIGMDSIGSEIRFVTMAPNIDLYITAQKPEFSEVGKIRIYKGNFLYQVVELEPNVTKFHRITPPAIYSSANKNMLYQGGFSPDVWRIVCDRSTYVVHGINVHGHEIRPPKKEEVPHLNWLAYGSSITNSNLDGYVHVAASKLRMQVQNKGFSGCCHIEKELVDYILDECDFDVITCELGVNMRANYTPEEFEKRASYLIDRLVRLQKPALIITAFPNSYTSEYTTEANKITESETAFNHILVKLVRNAECSTLQLIHGYNILDDINGLSADLIHPTVYGHAVMGMNLAVRMKVFLSELGMLTELCRPS